MPRVPTIHVRYTAPAMNINRIRWSPSPNGPAASSAEDTFEKKVAGGDALGPTGEPVLSKRQVLMRFGFMPLSALALMVVFFSFVRYNGTASVPIGWYFHPPAPAQIERGASVLACLEGEAARFAIRRGYLSRRPYSLDCAAWIAPMLKRVLAVPGDTVRLYPGGLFVNGIPRRPAPPTVDRQGRRVQPRYGTHVLGEGTYWLASDISCGYDSRYFGPVRRAQVFRLAVPLWITIQPENPCSP
jgi:conjugative transfer signal peptidase TraF